jgi:germination protein M
MEKKKCVSVPGYIRMEMLCVMLACLVLFSGCGNKKLEPESDTYIYYVNVEDTALTKKMYEFSSTTMESEIDEILAEMQKDIEDEEYKSAFPEDVKIESWDVTDGKVQLHFNGNYERMSASTEVLLKAAVVQSLGQIDGVNSVEFYIGDSPLLDAEGNEVGKMRPSDFVQNTGSSLHSYQKKNMTLYFANEAGDGLETEEVSVRYNSNMSVEKVVVEQLIKGPVSGEVYPLIPPETKLLGISIKDQICYVNLDEGFLNTTYAVDPEAVVYSIVNSLIDNGSVTQVQISVNGESNIMYQDTVDLSKPLEKDAEYGRSSE